MSNETLIQKVKRNADYNTQTLGESEATQHSRRLLAESGKVLTPINHRHIGSAVVHFYETNTPNKREMVLQTLFPFTQELTEAQASIGYEELKNKMMASFGRKGTRS